LSPTTERRPGPGPKKGPVIVLGHTGLLGQALIRVAMLRGFRTLGISRRTVPGLHLARQNDLGPWLDPLAPALVINAAAQADLDANEADPAAAQELHAGLPALLADWGRRRGTPWVQVSTDHYWRHRENHLHDEEAIVRPPNVFARSRRAGEERALVDPGCLVVRTHVAGFRGRAGQPTFVEQALASLAGGEPFDAYTGVWASCIEVHQFARALFDLVEIGATGLVHLAARESLSQADFIEALAHAAGHDARLLRRLSRPAASDPPCANAMGLDVARAESLLGRLLPRADEVIAAIASNPQMPRPAPTLILPAAEGGKEAPQREAEDHSEHIGQSIPQA
jgi:dTDP-4-dehydrorhamnose reductase